MSATTQEQTLSETGLAKAVGSRQLVSFRLDSEEYAMEITKIREIILMGAITHIPQTPDYVEGLINLRSTVIPVIDLRRRFGLPEAGLTSDSRIMVLSVSDREIGIIVDAVNEVLRVAEEQIADPPSSVDGLGHEYLTGLVKLEDRLLILLDADRLFDQETMAIQSTTNMDLS